MAEKLNAKTAATSAIRGWLEAVNLPYEDIEIYMEEAIEDAGLKVTDKLKQEVWREIVERFYGMVEGDSNNG